MAVVMASESSSGADMDRTEESSIGIATSLARIRSWMQFIKEPSFDEYQVGDMLPPFRARVMIEGVTNEYLGTLYIVQKHQMKGTVALWINKGQQWALSINYSEVVVVGAIKTYAAYQYASVAKVTCTEITGVEKVACEDWHDNKPVRVAEIYGGIGGYTVGMKKYNELAGQAPSSFFGARYKMVAYFEKSRAAANEYICNHGNQNVYVQDVMEDKTVRFG